MTTPPCPRWSATGASATSSEHWLWAARGPRATCAWTASIGSRTSALHEPYVGTTSRGHLYLAADEVAEHVVACTRAGLQAGFHVIGDRAVAEVVAGFEAACEVLGRDGLVRARHRLEHVEMATTEQMTVLAGFGVTASMQPVFDACGAARMRCTPNGWEPTGRRR